MTAEQIKQLELLAARVNRGLGAFEDLVGFEAAARRVAQGVTQLAAETRRSQARCKRLADSLPPF